jgi:hypothetical protein
MEFNASEALAICQFFNIPNASVDEMMFLLFMSTHGLKRAKRVAETGVWKCEAAIEAVDTMVNGRGHGLQRITPDASRASGEPALASPLPSQLARISGSL